MSQVRSRFKPVTNEDLRAALQDVYHVDNITHAVRHRLGMLIQRAMVQRNISPYDLIHIGKPNNVSTVLGGKSWSLPMVVKIIDHLKDMP